MERTETPTMLVDTFKGINQAFDRGKLGPEYVPWTFGMVVDETVSIHRLNGKMQASTNAQASILSIRQLSFDSSQVVVIHAGTAIMRIQVMENMSTPPNISFPTIPFINLNGGAYP